MAELLVLDPDGVAEGDREELDLTPFVRFEGVDWGTAQVEAHMSAGRHGSLPVDHDLPNTTVTVPLNLMDRGGVSFSEIRRRVQAKVALFQAEGGWVGRSSSEGVVYGQVVGATLVLGGDSLAALGLVDDDAALTLEILGGEWLGDEVELDAITETSAAEIVAVLQQGGVDAVIKGDRPGHVRIVVSEDEGVDQLGLFGGFRSRYYNDAATAALVYEAEDLTPLDQAAVATVTGASGGGTDNAVEHDDLGTNWTPVLSTEIDGVGHMTHRGTYRVWVRAYSDADTPDVRFVYGVGDLVNPTQNPAVTVPAAAGFYILDLGEIRLDPVGAGTHRWLGVIQGRGESGGENLHIDKVWFQPVSENAWRVAAPATEEIAVLEFTARDEFNQADGDLDGKVAPLGGTWDSGGVTTDFAVADNDGVVFRQTASPGFRVAWLPGTSLTNTAVRADIQHGFNTSGIFLGVAARVVDASNFLAALLVPQGTGIFVLTVVEVISSSQTALATASIGDLAPYPAWNTISAIVDSAGRFTASVGPQGGTPTATVSGRSANLATGGTLASGYPGIADNSAAGIRVWDNFAAWVPNIDAVLFADQTAELSTDGIARADSAGNAYGPLTPIGDLPRIPPSGLEGRPVELLLKASRGDLDQLPDDGIDDISVIVHYRPSYLYLPEDVSS